MIPLEVRQTYKILQIFLNEKFSTATKTKIQQYDLDVFEEDNIEPNCLHQLEASRLYSEYWSKS